MFADDIKIPETMLGKVYSDKFKELYLVLKITRFITSKKNLRIFIHICCISWEVKGTFPTTAFPGKIFLTKKTADTGGWGGGGKYPRLGGAGGQGDGIQTRIPFL